MAERLEADIRICRADLRSFFLYTLWLKKRLTVPVLIFVAGVGLLLVLQDGQPWLGIALLALTGCYVAWRMNGWSVFGQSIREQGLRYHLSLTGRELVLENQTQGGGSKYRLEKFAEARETGAHFFLYHGPMTAVILPKRELPDELALALRQQLRERLGSRYGRI